MNRLLLLLTILVLSAFNREPKQGTYPSNRSTTNEKGLVEQNIQDRLLQYVKNLDIPDSLVIDNDQVIFGDFNGDESEDFASIVTNLENGYKGVLIVHNSPAREHFIFGAGQEINGMKNLDWIDIFKTIPKGEVIAPTLVDNETGDIIGPDKTKEFRLIGTGIYMHVNEACGGGILFWNGNEYNWYHLE